MDFYEGSLLCIIIFSAMITCFIFGFYEGESVYKDYMCKRCRKKILGKNN